MAKIYESLKSAVDQKMLKSAAATLGEDESKVSSAIHKIIPSQLIALLKKGANEHVDEVFKLAGKHKLFEKKEELFKGHGIIGDLNIGERAENALLGSRDPGYPSAIAAESGVSHESADRLSNWVAGLIAGFIGEKMIREKRSLKTFLTDLEQERSSILKDIPSRLASLFGISAPAAQAAQPHVQATAPKRPEIHPKKRGNGWIIWLIILLLAALIAWLCLRSCCRKNKVEVEKKIENVTVPKVNETEDVMTNLTLGDGTVMKVKKGGCEEKMVNYLNSGNYKNASLNDLKSRWLEFDRLEFVFNSSNEMLGNSEQQLGNIAAILRHYPDVKIKIAGYADQKGGKAINHDLSHARANHVKTVFVADGIAPARISTAGFGEEYATIPANASDAARAIDRHIGFRFDK